MVEDRNEYIKAALQQADSLKELAEEGESVSIDDGCILLYGVVRDCAYRIKDEAEREKAAHKAMGVWV